MFCILGNRIRSKCRPSTAAFLRTTLLVFSGVAVSLSASGEDHLQERLAKVKAAYIYNVIKFTSWPESAQQLGDAIRVGVIGHDRVADFLFAGFKSRTAQNRSLLVEQIDDVMLAQNNIKAVVQRVARYHVVYFSAPMGESERILLGALKGAPILLTIGSDSQLLDGGMVSFVFDRQSDKVRLLVNLESMQLSGLSMSSKLLKFAKIIGPQ